MKTSAPSWKPYAPNLAINKSWSILSKAYDRFINMAQTKPPLVFFHFSFIFTKQSWMLWFFLKPVSNFDNLPSMKFSIWIYMILSKIFGTWCKTLTGLWLSLSKSSFFKKIEVTSTAFNSPGKHRFRIDELIIFVRRENEHQL